MLFGEVASAVTAYGCPERLDEAALARVRAARGAARARAWRLGEAPRRVVLDIDATLATAHSEKEHAAGNYNGGFGFHPLRCFEAITGEAPAGILRPGNAGANTAADHVAVLEPALARLPEGTAGHGTLVRCDSAGATHDFLDAVAARGLAFSGGLQPHRESAHGLPRRTRERLDGGPRQRRLRGARVPGSQSLPSTSRRGRRAQGRSAAVSVPTRAPSSPSAMPMATASSSLLTNQQGSRIARLEQLHRRRAAIEDSIRCAKAAGLRNLPFRAYAMNAAWLELVLMGIDLLAGMKRLLLSGTKLAACEPKRLRYRLLHVAGRIVSHARRHEACACPRTWPWGRKNWRPRSRACKRCAPADRPDGRFTDAGARGTCLGLPW